VKKHVPVSRRISARAPQSRRIILLSPGPAWLQVAPCPVTVSEAMPGEQDSPGAAGEAKEKPQYERCQPFGHGDMRLYL
jgi:hypothetical protein